MKRSRFTDSQILAVLRQAPGRAFRTCAGAARVVTDEEPSLPRPALSGRPAQLLAR
jgi:hypothetical protein